MVVRPVGDIIFKRFTGMVEFYQTDDSSRWQDKFSADIREVMWKSAAKVIEKNPISGVGSYFKMETVRNKAGQQANILEGFRHVHNTVLDELLNNYIVGLFILLFVIVAIFAQL